MSRREHYADFYSDAPPVEGLVLVVGNCLGESLRLLLASTGAPTMRVPPIFELDADDTTRVHALASGAAALVAQPVRDGYRGLPLGTAELAARLPTGVPLVTVPVVRYAGLHPHQVVHHPPGGVGDPPLVPYQDLRALRSWLHPRAHSPEPTSPDQVRAVAAHSVAELQRRETTITVPVSDLLMAPHGPSAEHMRTVNHPGNPVLLGLAQRVADVLGLPAPTDPGRPLLDDVRTPLEPVVAATWDLPAAVVTASWRVGGEHLAPAVVDAAHHSWYDEHPAAAHAVWERFADVAVLLGLA